MAAIITTAAGFTWQEVAADRQAYRDASIASITPPIPVVKDIPLNTTSIASEHLTPEEVKITESVVEELLPQLASGKISAVDVIKAFMRRAALAQQATNCLTELLPSLALARASYLDSYLSTHKKPIGPLHGLPISVKEHIGMKGLDLNAGFVSWVGRVGEENAHILQILHKAGAVFYARTTQPQSLMHLECSSNLYGVTTNPFNTNLTSGGSSGGEGALIGFRGSCLGIGTDIGGSIRSPAANNGLYGIKPTSGRLPVSGWSATMLNSESIIATIGPMSTSLEGCKIFIKTLIDAQPWHKEPTIYPISWNTTTNFFPPARKLKIAVMWDDGVVKVHPPVTRVLKEVVEKLKQKENVEIVEWKPWKHDEAWEIIANLYFSDGGAEELAAMSTSSEPILPLTKHILTENPHLQSHSIASYWQAIGKRQAYRSAYASLWNATSTSTGPNGELEGMVDVILSPVGPSAAPKLGTAKWWGYTSQWNLLDYPAVVFPVSKVDVGLDGGEVEVYEGRNARDKENWTFWKDEGAEGYRDAPVSLQLVGRRFEDEKMIQALEIITKEIGLPFAKYV